MKSNLKKSIDNNEAHIKEDESKSEFSFEIQNDREELVH